MSAKTTKTARFAKGTGVYTCQDCGKRTREVDRDAAAVGMCSFCYEVGGWANSVSDGDCDLTGVPEMYRQAVAEQLGIAVA